MELKSNCQTCKRFSLDVEIYRFPIGFKDKMPAYREYRLCPECVKGVLEAIRKLVALLDGSDEARP